MEETEITELIKKHEGYRINGINLIPSENRLSPPALKALSSDLAGRYGTDWYGGSEYAEKIYEKAVELTKKLFKVKYAFLTPVSGNICDLSVIFAFTKSGDEVAGIPKEHGGYPFGYEKFERKFIPLPMKGHEVDIEKISGMKCKLLLMAQSTILFPFPLTDLMERVDCETGAYDASHVLGLIAGKEFQQPLKEGMHIMFGSTHKSFPGPQGGIVMTNDDEHASMLEKYLLFSFDEGIGLVDNIHMNRVASLAIVVGEMLREGKKYARNVISNAKYLASKLHEYGIPVKYEEKGFTESHQFLLDMEGDELKKFFIELEKNKVFIDSSGRVGVAEVTHIGMGKAEMDEIAEIIKDIHDGKSAIERVRSLSSKFA